MNKMFIIFLVFLTSVFGNSYEKYIDLLSEEDKQEFLDNVARRVMEEVASKENATAFSRELSDDQLKEHNAFVQTVLQQESEQMRRKADANQTLEDDKTDKDLEVKPLEPNADDSEVTDKAEIKLQVRRSYIEHDIESTTILESNEVPEESTTSDDEISATDANIITTTFKTEEEPTANKEDDQSTLLEGLRSESTTSIATTEENIDKSTVQNSTVILDLLKENKASTVTTTFKTEEQPTTNTEDEQGLRSDSKTNIATTENNIDTSTIQNSVVSPDLVNQDKSDTIDSTSVSTTRINIETTTESSAILREPVENVLTTEAFTETSPLADTTVTTTISQDNEISSTDATNLRENEDTEITTSEPVNSTVLDTLTDKGTEFPARNMKENVTLSLAESALATTELISDNIASTVIPETKLNKEESELSRMTSLTTESLPMLTPKNIIEDVTTEKPQSNILKNKKNGSPQDTMNVILNNLKKYKSKPKSDRIKTCLFGDCQYRVFEYPVNQPVFIKQTKSPNRPPSPDTLYYVPIHNYSPNNAYYVPDNVHDANPNDQLTLRGQNDEDNAKQPFFISDLRRFGKYCDEKHSVYKKVKVPKKCPTTKKPKVCKTTTTTAAPLDRDNFPASNEPLHPYNRMKEKSVKNHKAAIQDILFHYQYLPVPDPCRQNYYDFLYANGNADDNDTVKNERRDEFYKYFPECKISDDNDDEEALRSHKNMLRTGDQNIDMLKNNKLSPTKKLVFINVLDDKMSIKLVKFTPDGNSEFKSEDNTVNNLKDILRQMKSRQKSDKRSESTTENPCKDNKSDDSEKRNKGDKPGKGKLSKGKPSKDNDKEKKFDVNSETIREILKISDEKDVFEVLEKVREMNMNTLRSDNDVKYENYMRVLKQLIERDDVAIRKYDWLTSTVQIRSALSKLFELITLTLESKPTHPYDMQLLKYIVFIHDFASDVRLRHTRQEKPQHKLIRRRNKPSRRAVFFTEEAYYNNYAMKKTQELSAVQLNNLKEFLANVADGLLNLHEAIKSIASITKYKNQKWHKNLKEIYLNSEEKQVKAVLLHICVARMISLIETSCQDGLDRDYVKFIKNHREVSKKILEEMLFILKIIDEINYSLTYV